MIKHCAYLGKVPSVGFLFSDVIYNQVGLPGSLQVWENEQIKKGKERSQALEGKNANECEKFKESCHLLRSIFSTQPYYYS